MMEGKFGRSFFGTLPSHVQQNIDEFLSLTDPETCGYRLEGLWNFQRQLIVSMSSHFNLFLSLNLSTIQHVALSRFPCKMPVETFTVLFTRKGRDMWSLPCLIRSPKEIVQLPDSLQPFFWHYAFANNTMHASDEAEINSVTSPGMRKVLDVVGRSIVYELHLTDIII